MIELKSIELEKHLQADDIISGLQWNTKSRRITFLNLFYYFTDNGTKKWAGQIDRESRHFKLMRNKSKSSIVIDGKIIERSEVITLSVKFQLSGYALINFISTICITVYFLLVIPMDMIAKYWWIIIAWIALFSMNFIRMRKNLNDTEASLIEYFDYLSDNSRHESSSVAE